MLKEFKEFISRGNAIDLAVGIIIGGAFTAIVTSLVSDLITPIISIITLGTDFSSFSVTIGEGANASLFKYGAFIQAVINFLVIAIVVFLLVKGINKLTSRLRKEEEDAETAEHKECPFCKSSIPIEAVRCPDCTSTLDDALLAAPLTPPLAPPLAPPSGDDATALSSDDAAVALSSLTDSGSAAHSGKHSNSVSGSSPRA